VNSGLPGTPFLILNGQWFRASPTLINLEAAIRLELLASTQYNQPPVFEIDQDAVYIAEMRLTTGDVEIQLFPGSAPASVANFIFLANEGWYDDTIFHRVDPGSYVEGGDPSGTGFGGPGYFLPDEIDPSLEFEQPGRLVLIGTGPNTIGSRYAITLRNMPEWQGSRPIIGQVIEGLPLLMNLKPRDPLDDLLTEPQVRIIEIVVKEQ
jgi:cyclophilin family peptidyl-prolyl cis-trans isomerase